MRLERNLSADRASRESGPAPWNWWERPGYTLALIALSALPLLWPKIPPLVDLLGHMGRYRVQLDLDHSVALQQYFSLEWHIIGNLGADLLLMPLSKLMSLEHAVKLIAISIPVLTTAGFLTVARELHGRLPATAAFAVPLAYSFPFQYGFVNFTLSMALALLAFALWLRLTRAGRIWLRTAVFVPVGLLVWLCHAYGWGFLGLLCAASIVGRRRTEGEGVLPAFWNAGVACLPLVVPLILMVLWRDGSAHARTGGWFSISSKLSYLAAILRTQWRWLDIGSAVALLLLVYFGVRSARLSMERTLATAALFCLAAFLIIPADVFGSHFADMRLAPYLVALAVLAIDTSCLDRRWLDRAAIGALAFVVIRIATTAVAFAANAQDLDRYLQALDAIPEGAPVLSLVEMPCDTEWSMPLMSHIAGLAIERKDAFANDQWTTPGMNALQIRFPQGEPLTHDPSQIVYPRRCGVPTYPIEKALASIPHGAFTRLWIIGFKDHQPLPEPEFRMIWHDADSAVYSIGPGVP